VLNLSPAGSVTLPRKKPGDNVGGNMTGIKGMKLPPGYFDLAIHKTHEPEI
jgi:hypothetical protein